MIGGASEINTCNNVKVDQILSSSGFRFLFVLVREHFTSVCASWIMSVNLIFSYKRCFPLLVRYHIFENIYKYLQNINNKTVDKMLRNSLKRPSFNACPLAFEAKFTTVDFKLELWTLSLNNRRRLTELSQTPQTFQYFHRYIHQTYKH